MRRLTPLYAAAFLQGLVLWYAVEKLFMTSIGFTAATIGFMAAAYSVVMLVVDTPAGVLADRWSRKGMLIIGSVALALSGLICGLSHSVPVFIIGAAIWGIFFAFYSGMYDSIVYDTLAEEAGHADHYERYYGRIRIMDSTALIIGSLLGGLIGSQFGPRASFLLSVPLAIISIIPLLLFKEPQLHKNHADTTLPEHIKSTLSAVLHHGSLAGILIILVLGAIVSGTIFEFSQLWLIGTHAPTAIYGPSNALILSTIGLAGLVAHRLNVTKARVVVPMTIIFVLCGIATILVPNTTILILALGIACLISLALDIIYLRRLHDQLPSHVRSGASSAINTMNRALFVAVALAFGWLTQHFNVFAAGWLVFLPILAVSTFLVLPLLPSKKPQTT
jgi:predicted MFS family arabinose efflux permease